jgi:Zn-dependent protease with chaperone function
MSAYGSDPGTLPNCRLSGNLTNPFDSHPKMLYRVAAISRNVAP